MLLPPVMMRVFYEDQCTSDGINEKIYAIMQKVNRSLEGQRDKYQEHMACTLLLHRLRDH